MTTPAPTRAPSPAVVVIALAAVLIMACGGSDGEPTPAATDAPPATATATPTDEGSPTPSATPSPEMTALQDARRVWEARGADEYTYLYVRACECTEEVAGPNRVYVLGGRVIRTEHHGSEIDPAFGGWTVEELFGMTAEAINGGSKLEVEFLPTGVPKSLRLDLDALAVDGGFAIEISSFADRTGLRARLEAARERWRAVGPAAYTLTYSWSCFCDPPRTEVTVVDGSIVESRVLEGTGFGDPLTVEGLFAEVEAALDRGVPEIQAGFDPFTGFPTSAYVDPLEFAVDDEWGFGDVTVEPGRD